MNARLVIFDWDGTLADSHAKIVTCLRAAMTQVGGPDLPDLRLRSAIGLGLPETAAYLHPAGDVGFRSAFVSAYRDHWLARNAERVEMFEGVASTLRSLRSQGWTLAVATGKSRAGLDRELGQSGLGELLPVSRCADETASKPDPRMLDEIFAHTGIGAEAAIVVGDTSHDLEMARRAGTRSIAVSYGAHDRETLARYEPIAIVDDVRDLVAALPPLG